ncbi:COG4280 domain-containing protein [Achromobacter aloeverae]|uniref:GDT1 family protein n=1 Tax=Achromobacter aloeverae TaxID=1750518 RepID=A0A4V1MSV6_9BURK|nr:hypothetical protein [Achromobacter aloeverae]RXN93370.1 hypothetical protein C7R54_06670 [Achromobacter aloeverae]
MHFISWSVAAPAVASAFLASVVEVVEAFTIILVVATLRGWRAAILGTVAALGVLAVLVLALGPVFDQLPLHILQLVIGVLLLLFGLGWLRKAVLRSAGVIPMHDEDAIFATARAQLSAEALRQQQRSQDWLAGLAVFKAVLLEGLEVAFIILAVGAGRGLLFPAALGALGACAAVLIVGAIAHKPLSRVPENKLKFAVGVMLSSFGVFWTGEGLGVAWPGADLALLVFAAVFLATGLATARFVRNAMARSKQCVS